MNANAKFHRKISLNCTSLQADFAVGMLLLDLSVTLSLELVIHISVSITVLIFAILRKTISFFWAIKKSEEQERNWGWGVMGHCAMPPPRNFFF